MKDTLTKEQATFLYDMADRWAEVGFNGSDEVNEVLREFSTELRTFVTQSNGLGGSLERIMAGAN